MTALTSASVDAIMISPSIVAGQISAGNFRALAYSDASRADVYPDVPTFIEQGYDFSFALPRGLVMPPNLPEGVQDWWVSTMLHVVETPEWAEYLRANALTGNYLWGEDLRPHLEALSDDFERILRAAGEL